MTWSRFRRASNAALFSVRAVIVFFAVLALVVGAITSAQATLTNGENAVDILGEFNSPSVDTTADYVKGCVNNGASSLGFNEGANSGNANYPGGVLDSTNNRLFVADASNNRVLVFNLNGSNQLLSKTAANVLGQADFISCSANKGGSTSQSSMSGPTGMDFDSANNRLFVADAGNCRVLVYSTSSITNGMNASYELGQSNFTNAGCTVTQALMGNTVGVAYDSANTRLFVSDYGNSRVLVFNVAPGTIASGENASYELGQASGGTAFTTKVANDTQSAMNSPAGLAYDSADTLLHVADSGNHRTLVFNVAPASIANGENATSVLGQANFTSNTGTTTQSGLKYPAGLAYDSANNRLFVGDYGNNRVVDFSTANVINGENATDEVGQFTSYSVDTTNTYTSYCTGNGLTPLGFSGPTNVAIDGTNHWLYVMDAFNNRILIFPLTTGNLLSSKTPSYVLGQTSLHACGGLNAGGSSAQDLYVSNQPTSSQMAVDTVNNRLFVADSNNNRVLVFTGMNSPSTDMSATYILGGGGTATQSTLYMNGDYAGGLALDTTHQMLYVADTGNNRVMVFNVAPGTIASSENASYELGQAAGGSAFTVGTANQGGSTSQSSLSAPVAAAIDITNQLLYVADSGNHRVMVFNVASGTIANGENASYEIGQPSGTAFTSATQATTQSGMNAPLGLAFDATNNRLFVGDLSNVNTSRVTIYNTASISNGMNASYVLGSPNFTTETFVATQAGVGKIFGIGYDSTNSYLYVADEGNNRVTIYDVSAVGISPTLVSPTQSGYDACVVGSGALYCWGYNGYGEVGVGNTTKYPVPEQVGSDTTWTAISQGDSQFDEAACGIDNGALYCWGRNQYGELGLGNTTQYTTPTQVGSATNWTSVSTSGSDTCAINSSGNLYCWGRNDYGELGQGSTVQYTTPQQVPPPPNSNLVGWWQFGEGSGTSTADASGNSNTGTLHNGPTWTTSGVYGDALTFASASSQYVQVADASSLDLSGSWTVSTWVNLSSLPASGNNYMLVGKDNNNDTLNYGLEVSNTAGTYSWEACFADSSNNYHCTSYAATINTGSWYLITGTWDGTTLTLYVNGTSVATSTPGHLPYSACCAALTMGWNYSQTTYAYYLSGTLDDVRVYNTKLSSTQVAALYNDNGWTSVSTGGTDTCGINGGALYCWGYNKYGEDGNTAASNTVFITSTTYNGAFGGVAGANTDCAARATAASLSGTFKAWAAVTTGTDDPNTTFVHSIYPYELVNGTVVATNWTGLVSGTLTNTISVNESGGAAGGNGDAWTNVATNGTAYTSGNSTTGNCASWSNSTSSDQGYFGAPGHTNSNWTYDGPGNNCSQSQDLYCVQQNANPTENNSPVQVGSATNWIAVSQGGYDTCGIRGSSGSGELYCWGENNNGELGAGNNYDFGAPVAIGTSISTTGWSAISIQNDGTNQDAACGVVSGALYCWGQNADGELGLGNTTPYNTPQQVGSATNWTAVSYGKNDACGISGGTLYCWGLNSQYEDGVGNATENTSPQAVSFGEIGNGEDAIDEIGQYNSPYSTSTVVWTQSTADNGFATALGIDGPDGVAVDPVHHYLFVSDDLDNRVMVYTLTSNNTLPTTSGGHSASYVLGQTSLNGAGNGGARASATTQSGLYTPRGLAVDPVNQLLYVADLNNHRVMVFPTTSLSNGENASYELGQADFTHGQYNRSNTTTPANNSLYSPEDVSYDAVNNRLYVADAGNNRVMVFSTSSLSNGENASYEFGQASGASAFTVGTANQGGSAGQNTLSTPYSVAYDSENNRLFVGDASNKRILAFNVASGTIANGENASNVLGEPDYVTVSASCAQAGMSAVYGIAYDTVNNRLFSVNQGEGLVYNAGPSTISNGMNASYVLGHTTFTNCSYSQGQGGLGLTNGTASYDMNLAYDSTTGYLYVPDMTNNRVMIFNTLNAGHVLSDESAQYVLGQSNFTNSTANEGGTTGQSTLSGPAGVVYDSTNSLAYVVDQTNNRVMQFNAATSSIASGETASDELGQYTTPAGTTDSWTGGGANNGPTALGFYDPSGLAIDPVHHYLFVSDYKNDRVMVYTLNTDNSLSTSSGGHTASYVLGQTSFQGVNAAVTTQSSLVTPVGLAVDPVNQYLYVADYGNNRVMVFPTSSLSSGENASYELGQANFTTGAYNRSYTTTPAQNSLYGPEGLAYDGANNRLIVTDAGNNRVMVFSTSGISNGENAAYELGQASGGSAFTVGTANQGGSAGQNTLSDPVGLAYDAANQRLFVGDALNNRIMIFNVATASIANGENASYELGQPSGTAFTSTTAACSQSGVKDLYGLSYDPNNNRLFAGAWLQVLAYNVNPGTIANGESASYVVGQPNFTNCSYGSGQAGLTFTSGSGVYIPGVLYDPGSGRLFVSDMISNRVMIFGADGLPGGDYFNP